MDIAHLLAQTVLENGLPGTSGSAQKQNKEKKQKQIIEHPIILIQYFSSPPGPHSAPTSQPACNDEGFPFEKARRQAIVHVCSLKSTFVRDDLTFCLFPSPKLSPSISSVCFQNHVILFFSY